MTLRPRSKFGTRSTPSGSPGMFDRIPNSHRTIALGAGSASAMGIAIVLDKYVPNAQFKFLIYSACTTGTSHDSVGHVANAVRVADCVHNHLRDPDQELHADRRVCEQSSEPIHLPKILDHMPNHRRLLLCLYVTPPTRSVRACTV